MRGPRARARLVPGLILLLIPMVAATAGAEPPVTYAGHEYAKPPPPPAPVVVERDPYDTPGIVVTGAGFGGLMIKSDLGSTVAPIYQLHLGLAVGAAEFGLRTNLVPDAFEGKGLGNVALYATRATFDYRFLRCAVVHPVAGFGLESIVSSPASGSVGHAFAGTVRAGLELAFPLRTAALALGIDLHGHLPFAATESFPSDLELMLGFGAYVDYRF